MDLSLLCLFLVYFLVNLTYLLMAPFYEHVARAKGISALSVGIVFSVMPGTAFAFTLFTPYLFKYMAKRTSIGVGLLISSAAMVLLAVSDYFDSYEFFGLGLVSRIMSGASIALVQTAGIGQVVFSIAGHSYQSRSEEIFSLLEMCAGVSVSIGPIISAPLYDVVGFQAIFYGAAVVVLVSVLQVLLLRESKTAEVEKKREYGMRRVLACRVRGM